MKLYIKDGLSTFVENSIIQYDSIGSIDVEVKTLSEVCSEYVTGEISFLKVDVEGLEKNVLEGADFKNYRPWIVIVESTKPTTMEFCYDEWEYILLDNGYHYTYSCGVNRWYVANEKEYLDSRFISIDELKNKYCIFSLKLEDY